MLPDRLGDFVTALGANVYVPNLRHDSEQLNQSAEFGLSAEYNAEIDKVTAIVGPRAVDLGGVVGEVALYKVTDTRTDHKLRVIEFDASMRRRDGSFNIGFSGTGEDHGLYVLAELVLPSGKTMHSLAQVGIASARKPVIEPVHKPVFTERQDGTDPQDGIVDVDVVVHEHELRDVLTLDFHSAEPVTQGTAALTYTGGGNRYLVAETGPVLQMPDRSPWSLEAGVMVEPDGGNIFGAYALTTPAYTYADTLVVTVSDMNMSGFTEIFKSIRASNINREPQAWEFLFDSVSIAGDMVSGSAFVEFQSQEGNARCQLGLRMFNAAGQHLRDVFTPVPDSKLNVYGVTWTNPNGAAPIPGTAKLVLRVEQVAAGETIGLTLGFPQLESNSSIGTRSTGVKAADKITCLPGYAFDNSYGRFDITVTPNYEGLPGAYGPQLFFDTRDAAGLNGFYLGHQPSGLLEFGAADAVGSVFVRSASAIQLTGRTRITCFFDAANRNLRIDVDGSIAVDKNLNALTLPTELPRIRFGRRYDDSARGSFQLHGFVHGQTQE